MSLFSSTIPAVLTLQILLGQGDPSEFQKNPPSISFESYVSASQRGDVMHRWMLPDEWPTKLELTKVKRFVLQHPDYHAYHFLILLRSRNPEVYAELPIKLKSKILCSYLENASVMNDWGILDTTNSSDSVAAKSLIELGVDAIPDLERILPKRKVAHLFGSEEGTLSDIFKYRRADYAYRYIKLILGSEPAFLADPKDRDREIESLMKSLAARREA